MKKQIATAFLAVLTAISVHAAPTLIDFNDQVSGAPIDNQYLGLGVKFSNASISDYTCCGTPTPALVNAQSGGSNDQRYSSLTMTFTDLVSLLSFSYNNYGSAPGAQAFAYGAGALLLETLNMPIGNGLSLLPVSFSSAGIQSVEIRTVGYPSAGWLFAIDDLSFERNAVPEPGTLALFGLGLLGMGVTRRRLQ